MQTLDKRIIDACINYYDIISERYTKDDELTKTILLNYKFSTENTDPADFDLLNKLVILDRSVYAYFNDEKFRQIIINKVDILSENINDFMINEYNLYKQDPINNVETSKWI